MAIILNGKELSKEIEIDLKDRIEKLKSRINYIPKLATILVGNDPASLTYVAMKCRACERIGLGVKDIHLNENTTTDELIAIINELNKDDEICGILLQHPVPKQIDEVKCFNTIAIEKDVDGVNTASFGAIANGLNAYVSATPLGITKILDYYKIDVDGMHAVVVGRSAILGKPISALLLNRNATVTICHSHTKNLPEILKTADIVVGAVGKPKFIKAEWLKPNTILIDAGYNAGNVGDIDLEKASESAFAYTPVPGGVGPMTIASLLTQCVESVEKNINK